MNDDIFNSIFQDKIYDKALILYNQGRYTQSKKIILEGLKEEPNDSDYLSLYSIIEIELGNTEKALDLINSAISQGLVSPIYYVIKSEILIRKSNYQDAETWIRKAITINPEEANFYAKLANIKFLLEEYEKSIEFAQKSLEFEPNNIEGLNTLGISSSLLGKPDKAFSALKDSLKEEPNNEESLLYFAAILLENGKYDEAEIYYNKVITLNPNNSIAKEGFTEAIKARNYLYGLFLRYSFWISKKSKSFHWKLMLITIVIYRLLFYIGNKVSFIQPFVFVILITFVLFNTISWFIPGLSNLFLRIDRSSKHLLNEGEILSANFTGICLIISLISILGYFISGLDFLFLTSIFMGILIIPFSHIFLLERFKKIMIIYTVVMVITSIFSISNSFYSGNNLNIFTFVFMILFVFYQFITNSINITEKE